MPVSKAPVCSQASPAKSHSEEPQSSPALDELCRLAPVLKARALRLCSDGSWAEDLVQETLLRGVACSDQIVQSGNVRGWAFTVLRNLFVSQCRTRSTHSRLSQQLSATPEVWMGSSTPVEARAVSRSLRRAFSELPEVFAGAVALVDLGERAYREAAEELGVAVGTVMSRLHRGRRTLAAQLPPDPSVLASS